MENVGGIYYEIKADTHALLQADKQVQDVTGSMEDGFKKADKSADSLNTGLSKLASTIKLVIAASTLREMARMVQSYQEMAAQHGVLNRAGDRRSGLNVLRIREECRLCRAR